MGDAIPFWDLMVDTFRMGKSVSSGFVMTEEHAHQHHELMFNFSPIPIRHTLSGRVYTTDSFYILYRAPYVLHSSATLSEQTYIRYSASIHPCVFAEFGGICDLGQLRGRAECLIPTTQKQMETLEPLLWRLHRATKHPKAKKNAWIGTLAALLDEVSDLVPANTPDVQPSPPYIQEMMHYIVEHIDEDLTIDAMAEKFFCSHAKLTKDFRDATSLSLHEYVTAIRIARAKILLSTNMPLSMIAQRCGFSNESSFIRRFRQVAAMTPGEYREKNMRH